MTAVIIAFGVSIALAVVLVVTPALRSPLTRAPAGPRWRADAVPVSGGIAMAVGFATAVLVTARGEAGIGAVLGASTFLGAMGIIDDLRPLPPKVKIAAQAIGGLLLAAGGVRPAIPGGVVVETLGAVVWVVVVSNAVNLLDGMDGLAAGVGLVAGATVWVWNAPAPIPAAFVGAVVGFLPFNLSPARMFMGNGGSHWMGAVLAGLTLMDGGRAGGDPAALWAVGLVPVVLLAVPLFDTTFVVVERLRHRRPVTVGGTDHTSHRLVASGVTERATVGLLWAVGVAAAGTASLARVGTVAFGVGAIVLTALLATLARRLARVAVYD